MEIMGYGHIIEINAETDFVAKNEEFKKVFKNPFTGKYQVNPNFSESDLNEIERKNIEIIREIENLKNPILLSDYL